MYVGSIEIQFLSTPHLYYWHHYESSGCVILTSHQDGAHQHKFLSRAYPPRRCCWWWLHPSSRVQTKQYSCSTVTSTIHMNTGVPSPVRRTTKPPPKLTAPEAPDDSTTVNPAASHAAGVSPSTISAKVQLLSYFYIKKSNMK